MRGFTAALMAAAVALLVSLAAADSPNISYEEGTRRMFAEWKAKYGQTYQDAGEEECRYAVFKDSRRRVERNNAAAAGVTIYGINHLSSITGEERRAMHGHRGVRMGKESYEEETRRMFAGWKSKYGKTYEDGGGEECRYKLFKGNRRVVDHLNAAAGGNTYGLNQFGDLANEEALACCAYARVGEMEGKLSSRCQAAAATVPDYAAGRLIRTQVCRCIVTELQQSTGVRRR